MEFDKDKLGSMASGMLNWMKQNGRMLWGALALLFGFLLLIRSKELLGHLFVFLIGLVLVYYGLYLVKAYKVTGFIDMQLERARRKLLK